MNVRKYGKGNTNGQLSEISSTWYRRRDKQKKPTQNVLDITVNKQAQIT